MSKIDFLSQQIFSQYGEIKRARGSFLYTEKGVRLTDMYQMDGRAILGWEGGKARLVFKNTIERGQTGSFSTHHFHALERSVLELFGGFDFIKVCHESEVAQKMPRWFPWMSDISETDSFYFVPPFPFACDYVIVVGRENCLLQKTTPCTDCLQNDSAVNPALLSAFTRSIYDLKSALQTRSEEDFRFFDRSLEKYFTRIGPYLFVRSEIASSQEEYKKFALFCLENGIVISPNPKIPSLIPYGADYGVFRKLTHANFPK